MNDDLIGHKIGGYEITSVIGRGGMATVYKAHQVSMNRTVALKVLPRHFATDESYLQRFHQEVKIVSQLEHRNIVPVHDHGEYEGQPYIAMRFMPGGSVDDLLTDGPLALDRILNILEQIAPALDYAHSKGVLHRDLKPSNVLMDDDDGAYLTDFGIARILSESSAQITTQGVVGTPSYMSPEQAQGQPLDARSDLYALGVMLFEMATGRRPFESDTPYSIAVMQVTTPPPSPREKNPALTSAVEAVILKALKKRRDERFSSAAELVTALRKAMAEPEVDLGDTQPGFPADLPTAPHPVPAPSEQYPAPQPVTPTPPPPEPSSGSMARVPRVQRKRKPNNLLFGTMVGGAIGCGLLALLVIGGVLLLQETNRRAADQATATAQAGGGEETGEAAISDGVSGFTGGATSPALGADIDPGDGLLYFARRDENDDIYLLPLSSGDPQQLTDNPAADQYPVMSPDGTTIAFQSDRDGDFDILLMDADGGNVRTLVENDVDDRMPAWSLDGEWLVFSTDTRGDSTYDLAIVRSDGSDLQTIFSNGQRNSHARWSGDGRYIVFVTGAANDAKTWEIARYDLAAGELALLTDNDAKDWSPSFGTDGAILYLTEGDGFAAIAEISLDGDDARVIYDSPGYESSVELSPDGNRIAFTSDVTGRDEVYVMTADGDNVTQLTTQGGHAPTWNQTG